MPRQFLCLLMLLFTSIAVPANAEIWPAEHWSIDPAPRTAALEGLEAYAFAPRDEAERKGVRTDALLVIRDGQIVYERYAGQTTAATAHLTWSISKSVMATVLGVAFSENRFQLNDPAAKFYAPMAVHPDITLSHLLHWASGLDWQEDYEYAPLNSSVVAMLYTRGRRDMARFAAGHRRGQTPGTSFVYSSGDSNLLAAALKHMVGSEAYADYPWTALFEPLGIRSAVWETDGVGTFVGSSYAYMSARDLARIGLLMQRGGRWQGRQLLPQAWVRFVLTPFAGLNVKSTVEIPGAQWWLNRTVDAGQGPWPHAPADTFAALGHWGQALYVIPSAGLVIVRYADDRDGSYDHDQLLKSVLAAFGQKGDQ
ncbi:MAG TPA: serine hydrolase [Pseudomonas sp.]|jgi:CubicO group peptidase (beta-lactamase class C family)